MRSKININSGVAPITVYVEPQACGGSCIYCPETDRFPKSYIANEDTEYAASVSFDPSKQIIKNLEKLPNKLLSPHNTIPLEIIVLGGSFSALKRPYRKKYVLSIYECLSKIHVIKTIPVKAICSVFTVECRPDQITHKECVALRSLGVSKVEIGVQHTDDGVLVKTGRGHSNAQTITATRLLKSAGFKVGYHVMIGLPGSSYSSDHKMLSDTLWGREYQPDYLKIYPCELLRDSNLQPALYSIFNRGEWTPPNDEYCITLLDSVAGYIPPYVRISRIQRQFARSEVTAGLKPGLRTRIHSPLHDISSREIRSRSLYEYDPSILEIYYAGSDIYFENCVTKDNSKLLVGIGRITLLDSTKAILREIKIFGEVAPIGFRANAQGLGYGSSLLGAIESHLSRSGYSMLFVNSAYGAKKFFLDRGYRENSQYLLQKSITSSNKANPADAPKVRATD